MSPHGQLAFGIFGMILGIILFMSGMLNIATAMRRVRAADLTTSVSGVFSLGGIGQYAVIHVPKGGCPKGFHVVRDFFSEADGAHEDACVRDDVDLGSGTFGPVDVLKPGEGFEITVPVRIAPPPEKANGHA